MIQKNNKEDIINLNVDTHIIIKNDKCGLFKRNLLAIFQTQE
jgi:hypothetical protein